MTSKRKCQKKENLLPMKSLTVKRSMMVMLCLTIVWAGLGGSLASAVYADASAIPPVIDGWVQISTAEQLRYVSENQGNYVNQNIKLMQDIVLPGSDYDWIPIGGNDYPAYSGIFDGQGYRISGIRIRSDKYNIGFFGVVTGTIQNLGVSVDIQRAETTASSSLSVGGLVGQLVGAQVIRCYTLGQVEGNNHLSLVSSDVGGLVGSAGPSSRISYSFSSASVKGGESIGRTSVAGLVGFSDRSSISHSYATGALYSSREATTFDETAGFIGFLIGSSIESSYTASVNHLYNPSMQWYAGFAFRIPETPQSNVSGSYYDQDAIQTTRGVRTGDVDISGISGLTTALMQQEESFVGWDFANTWAMASNVNGGRPYLRPVILTEALPQAAVQDAYEFQFRVFDGAAGGITWEATGLPPGLVMTVTGELSGTPSVNGVFPITVTAEDAGGATREKVLMLTVNEFASGITDFQLLPGSVPGSTMATGAPRQAGHTFAYRLSDSIEDQPLIGDALPAEAVAYVLDSDITEVLVGQYLSLYEVDALDRIQAWNQVQLVASHILPVPDPGSVTGAVYGVGGIPLEGAAVNLAGVSVTTVEEGIFQVPEIPPGQHELNITASGYRAVQLLVEVVSGEITDVGRIDLTVIPAASPPSYRPAPAAPSLTIPVLINGQAVQVKFVKETAEDGRSRLRLFLDDAVLNTAFAETTKTVIQIEPDEAIVALDIPLAAIHAVSAQKPEAAIEFSIAQASYSIPLSVWAASATQGTATLEIVQVTDTEHQTISDALAEQEAEMLGAPFQFAVYENNEKIPSYGNIYVTRSITLNMPVNPKQAGVVWMDADHRLHFIPTVFDQDGEITTAIFYAPHDSTYAVIRSNRTFEDLAGHWAQEEIVKLANKQLLQGIGPNTFAPNQAVTRAEFLTMLIRALGLSGTAGAIHPFTDVQEDDWYASAVKTAYQAGLITGHPDGTLLPNEPITREQMAVMLIRTVQFANRRLEPLGSADLDAYTDATHISGWARSAVEQTVSWDLKRGINALTFAPQALATRAQCAVVLDRLLIQLGFMDK